MAPKTQLEIGITREEARTLLGAPSSSGERGGSGIFALEHSWDNWDLPTGQTVHAVFSGIDATLGEISYQKTPDPDPIGVELEVYADYYQFYVQDLASTCDTSIIWDEPDSTKNGLVVGPGLVAISTKRYGTVPVRLEWYPKKPKFQWEGIDRVSEAGIEVTTQLGAGILISASPLPVFDAITPGLYGVRSMAWGLDNVTSDSEGGDHYIVQLWPVTKLPPRKHLRRPVKRLTTSKLTT